ncbi:MAG: FtsX-like permease family protein, partial [Methanobacteriota archaeon]
FLGFRLKEKIFGKTNPVGKFVYINDLPFQVIGVLKYKLQNSNYAMPDADRAYIPATTFTSMYGDQIVDNVVYQLEDPTLHKYVEKRIYSVLSQRLKFAPDDKMALSIWDTMEDQKITVAIMTGLTLFLGFIGAMTLFIAGVGVANIVYISIKERTREIGIKMAIGAKPADIMRQIIMESLFISFSGGILGIVISFLLIYTVRSIPSREEWFQYLGHPVFSWDIAVVTVVILSLIGFFAGYFPARKASRIQPTEALHYE